MTDLIPVADEIALDTGGPEGRFVRTSGPGGPSVKSVASAAQLRIDVVGARSPPDSAPVRLAKVIEHDVSPLFWQR